MASDFNDIFKPSAEQFAYLKCPDKISRALVNAGGPRLSADVIKRRLDRPERVSLTIGEPTISDGEDFRVRGLAPRHVVPKPPTADQLRKERNRIAALAALVPDRADKKAAEPAKPVVRQPIPRAAFQLIERVCAELGLTDERFFAIRTQGLPFAARSLVTVLLRERNPEVYSYPRIAEIMGRKDHSTMMYAVDQFGVCCRKFPQVAALYLELREGGE